MATISVLQNGMPARMQLWENVLSLLRQAIVSGALPPGTHLLETDLAKEMGVSRWPVRQAVTRLEQEHLVVTYPNRGAYVIGFSIDHIREIYALRRLLELYAVKEATKRLTPTYLDQLGALARQMGECAMREDADAMSAADMEFHRLLLRVAGSERLRQMWELLSAPARALLIISAPRDQDLARGILQRHDTLLNALATRDPETIEAAFSAHLNAAEERAIRFLQGARGSGHPGAAPVPNL
jgi:DNA-binding GntR family transcriptional regulator